MFFLFDAALFLLVLILVCFDRYVWSTLAYMAAIAFAVGTYTDNGWALTTTGSFILGLGPLGILYTVLAYLGTGFAVSFFRWGFYMNDFGKWLKVRVEKFNEKNSAPIVTKIKAKRSSSGFDRTSDEDDKAEDTVTDITPESTINKRIAFLKSLKEGDTYHEVRRGQFISVEQSDIYNYDSKMLAAAQTDETMINVLAPKAMNHKALITFWVLHWPYEIVSLFIKNFIINLIENFISLFGSAFTRIGKYFVRRATAGLQL